MRERPAARRFFAQGRNGYMGVDEYHYDSLESFDEGEDSGYPGKCIRNIGCYKPLKLGREIAALLNQAYWTGRYDERESIAEANQ